MLRHSTQMYMCICQEAAKVVTLLWFPFKLRQGDKGHNSQSKVPHALAGPLPQSARPKLAAKTVGAGEAPASAEEPATHPGAIGLCADVGSGRCFNLALG